MSIGDDSATGDPGKASRRSHAQRSASTRAKVIAAARDVLFSQGYSGATLHAIRDAAGMSLGAIQHQFPTKAKLMAAVVELADRWLNLKRLELQVWADNAPAIALYEKFGFEREGLLRAEGFRDGAFADSLAMARLRGL